MIQLLVETRLDPAFPLNRTELVPLMEDILGVLGLEQASLTLRLVDDAEIADLNKAFLSCFGPTNVLSFPAVEADEEDEEDDEWDEDDGKDQDDIDAGADMLLDEAQAVDDEGDDFGTEDGEQGPYLGEIVLSVDTLAREVRLYGQEPREHQVRLLAHATLHLAGLDHGPEMEAMTEAVLDALG
jgi:probable rRNA maturation factor